MVPKCIAFGIVYVWIYIYDFNHIIFDWHLPSTISSLPEMLSLVPYIHLGHGRMTAAQKFFGFHN